MSGFLSEAEMNVAAGKVATYDPVLISLVRRAMPNIIAYDVAGVQPMTGPTGLIFAMKSEYNTTTDAVETSREALHDYVDTAFSGRLTTTQAEALEGTRDAVRNPGGFGEMGFSIEKQTVGVKSRALRARYTTELAQDLKAVHGLDAESELASILSSEIINEINREMIDGVNIAAVVPADRGTLMVSGDYDMAVNDGRWAVEKYKNLIQEIERQANAIALTTRRGKGNVVICSANIASALGASGMLEHNPQLAADLQVDVTGNLFAGTLNGRMKVFVDPFAAAEYITVVYRGSNAYDAGVFYCPYVPLTMMRAIGEDDFQPRIGFKTRYGMTANPFVVGAGTDEFGTAASNVYFRRFTVSSI